MLRSSLVVLMLFSVVCGANCKAEEPPLPPDKLQGLLDTMKDISSQPRREGMSSAKKELFLKEAVASLAKEYGRFRIKLVFPVTDVRVLPDKRSSLYALKLGRCLEPKSLGGRTLAVHYLTPTITYYSPSGTYKKPGKVSHLYLFLPDQGGGGYSPHVKLTKEEMLSIGFNTHQYEIIVLVTVKGEDQFSKKLRTKVFFFSGSIYICHVSPAKVESKLVRVKLGEEN